ncbi:MAG: hypothetical protein K2Y37_16670 [Pirellulales bacterium]|nr:hypothetical protein [Pirellulales bacterium]
MTRDDELREYLIRSGIDWTPLDEATSAAAERAWRDIYGEAFVGRPRVRQGVKAERAYQQATCSHFLVVPFTSNIAGLPVHVVDRRRVGAYECRGSLVTLGSFHDTEFFVSPTDFSWTCIPTKITATADLSSCGAIGSRRPRMCDPASATQYFDPAGVAHSAEGVNPRKRVIKWFGPEGVVHFLDPAGVALSAEGVSPRSASHHYTGPVRAAHCSLQT